MNSQTLPNDFRFTAGYFGKLPNFPDFVKYNAAEPEILILDKWIQEGILWEKKMGKNISNNGTPEEDTSFSFLFPFTGTENILIGMLRPSRDKAGREFPFIIFMIINRNKLTNMPAYLIPLSFCGWFDYCGSLFNELKSTAPSAKENLFSINHKVNNMPGILFDAEKDIFSRTKSYYDKFISETSQKQFGGRTLGNPAGVKLPALLNRLEKALSFLRFKQNASVLFGIELSVGYDNENKFNDIGFFINLVMIITGRESLLPALFIKNGEHSSRLFIFFSSPSPQQYWDLFYSSGSNERILNVNADIDSAEIISKNFFSENDELKLKDILAEFKLKH